jgi:hypothetical protein
MLKKKKIALEISSTINKQAGKFARKLRRQNLTRNKDGQLVDSYIPGKLKHSAVAKLAPRKQRRAEAKLNKQKFKPVYNN